MRARYQMQIPQLDDKECCKEIDKSKEIDWEDEDL